MRRSSFSPRSLPRPRGRTTFEGRATFRTWLFVVARRELYSHLERRSRTAARFDPLTQSVVEIGTTPSQWLDREGAKRQVLTAMQRLPVEHQILLELYYWEDMPAREIATVVDVAEGTVRTRLRRAKQLLETALVRQQARGAGPLDVGRSVRHAAI